MADHQSKRGNWATDDLQEDSRLATDIVDTAMEENDSDDVASVAAKVGNPEEDGGRPEMLLWTQNRLVLTLR